MQLPRNAEGKSRKSDRRRACASGHLLAARTPLGHGIWRRYRNVAPLERAAEVPASLPSVSLRELDAKRSFQPSLAREARAAVATRYPPKAAARVFCGESLPRPRAPAAQRQPSAFEPHV